MNNVFDLIFAGRIATILIINHHLDTLTAIISILSNLCRQTEKKTDKEKMYIVHTAMPFRGHKNEALQSIKEIIVREKGSRGNVSCYMGQ